MARPISPKSGSIQIREDRNPEAMRLAREALDKYNQELEAQGFPATASYIGAIERALRVYVGK